jgi:hypothetical protein
MYSFLEYSDFSTLSLVSLKIVLSSSCDSEIKESIFDIVDSFKESNESLVFSDFSTESTFSLSDSLSSSRAFCTVVLAILNCFIRIFF